MLGPRWLCSASGNLSLEDTVFCDDNMTHSKGRSVTCKTSGSPGSGGGFVNWTLNLNTIQSDKFLNLLLSMVPVIYQKNQDDRHKKANGLWQDGLSGGAQTFSKRSEPHLDYHEFSEQAFHGGGGHVPASCSPKYDDYAGYSYCDGREATETTAMLQDEDLSSEGDDVIVETSQKLPKESSGVMALQILVPFLLAGFGTVSAGMVLDIVQVSFHLRFRTLCVCQRPTVGVFLSCFPPCFVEWGLSVLSGTDGLSWRPVAL